MTRSRTSPVRVAFDERGSQLIEMAFVFPLLMILVAGMADFGFMLQRFQVVSNAAREGARLGADPNETAATVEAQVNAYLTAAGVSTQNAAVAVTTTAVVPGGGASNFPARQVVVTVPYTFVFIRPMVSLIGATFATSLNLRATAVMRTETVVGAS